MTTSESDTSTHNEEQPYITLYINSLTSDGSKDAVFKNLRAALKRTDALGPFTKEVVLGFNWHSLPLSNYSNLRKRLIDEGCSASYINTILTICRQVLHWAFVNEQLTELSFGKIRQVIKSIKSNKRREEESKKTDDEVNLDWLVGHVDNRHAFSPSSHSNALPTKTVNKLIKSIGVTTNMNLRNRAMFLCMSHAGMRREEVSSLRLQDLRFASIASDSFITVLGKGAKLRNIPMNSELYKSLIVWSKLLIKTNDKRKASRVFRKINNVGTILSAGISNAGVYKVIRLTGERDNFQGLYPHKLRHYFATRLLLNGQDIFEVAKLLGHSNIETTRKYDDRGFSTLQRAVENFDT
jgi:site-specific recombinase XerC